MNRIARALVYVAVAALAAHVMSLYLPPSVAWIKFFFGFILGSVAVMASILVSDVAEGGPRP